MQGRVWLLGPCKIPGTGTYVPRNPPPRRRNGVLLTQKIGPPHFHGEVLLFGIIGLLASQYRIAYQVKVLAEKHLKDKEIAEILGEKSDYRIKKTREITSLYAENEILECLKKLANIDYQLKTSDVDANHLLEMFILNI